MKIEKICQMFMKLVISEHPIGGQGPKESGFIDQDGNFYEVECGGHEKINDILRNSLKEHEFQHFYQKWIKVSSGVGCPAFYMGQHSARVNAGLIPTARQKIGIQNYVKQEVWMMRDGQSAIFHGFGEVVRDNDQIKFQKWK